MVIHNATRRQAIFWSLVLWTGVGIPAVARAIEIQASRSVTVQPAGPRSGGAGSRYFNIQGKNNDRYASFGILVFSLPKTDVRDSTIKRLDIAFTQSIPGFAKNGTIKLSLAPDARIASEKEFETKFKFDPKSSEGLDASTFKNRLLLGTEMFKIVKTGNIDTFYLMLNQPARTLISDQLRAGGDIIVLVTPDDDQVAATYFGAGNDTPDDRPRLVMELETAENRKR